MANDHVLENLLGYWLGSVYYMSANMEIQFPPRPGGGIKRKSDSRISKFDSKRGCGGDIGRVHGGDVEAAAVTNMDLTGTNHPMAGFAECTALNSGGVSTAKSLKRLGVMGA